MKALWLPLSRPIATGSVYVAVILFGVAAAARLPLSLAPDLSLPTLIVSAAWPNATPEEVEALVTTRIEAEASLLRGVDEVSSVSGRGDCQVSVSFDRRTNMAVAEVELRDRLAGLQDELPDGVLPPAIQRSIPDEVDRGQFMVLQASGSRTAHALRDLLETRLLPVLLAADGVSGAEVYGGSDRQLRVDIDPGARARGLVGDEVGDLLAGVGIDQAVGSVGRDGRRVPAVVARNAPESRALRQAIVGTSGGRPVRLGQVARLADTWADPRRLSRLDGRPSVQVVLEREPGTNVIRVADAVAERLAAVAAELPADVTVTSVYDQSESIRGEINVLVERSLISLLAIFAVLALAHRGVRAPAAIIVSVVFSALATFVLFRVVGLGMNLVTLSGLTLAFGMAVDNAIVIMENIELRCVRFAHRDARHALLRVLAATREVTFPLLAATLTTGVVLAPFLYLAGDLREYYLPFILAVSLSLAASLLVALTTAPLLSRWSMRGSRCVGAAALDRIDRWCERGILSVTRGSVRRPLPVVCLSACLLVAAIWVFQTKVSRGSIITPEPDTTLRVSAGLGPGADIQQADALISRFESFVLEHPLRSTGYVDQVQTIVGETWASVIIRFDPGAGRTLAPEVLRQQLIERAATISGASISVYGQGPGYSSGGGQVSPSYELSLKGPDYVRLGELAEDLAARLERVGRIRNIDTNAASWSAQDARKLVLSFDRELLARLGMSVREAVREISPAIAAEMAQTTLRSPEGDVGATVRLAGADALEPHQLERTTAVTGSGTRFPLGAVLDIDEEPVMGEIHRREQQYERVVGFEYRGPRKVGDRVVKAFVAGTTMPPGFSLDEGSGMFLSRRDERQVWAAVGLAILLVFMVSAALFESLRLPFVALMAIPLGFIGIAFTFWALDESFDRTAYIGLILLVGISINNALLLVHRAGVLRRRSGEVRSSVLRAVRERLRPILVTTATSAAGLAPLAWGVDPGTVASWRSLAIAATAGLLTATVVSIAVIPALLTWIVPERKCRTALDPQSITRGEVS